MGLSYFRGDELPAWQATVTSNGVNPDFSSGWTFQVEIAATATATPVVTKTSGITGASGGVITVAWVAGELDIAEGAYDVFLTATTGGLNETVTDRIQILPRP